jgi:tRNA pseudouridine55 synthase
VEYVQRLPKTYRADFLLGRWSDTEDTDGTVQEIANAPQPASAEIAAILPRFVGAIWQRPPAYSALKVAGQRAYDLARRGEPPVLSERPVTVHSLDIVHYKYPLLILAIECGAGTYVRSLGRDIAQSLGTHAVMSRLVRTAIGPFHVDDAIDPNQLTSENLPAALLPMTMAVQSLPAIQLTADEVVRVGRGLAISRRQHGLDEAAACDSHGNLVAILVPVDADHLRPDKVLSSGG